LVSEGGIQFILFDARRGVATLIKILLFGAIAHAKLNAAVVAALATPALRTRFAVVRRVPTI
jgi:hypothetical protein